MPPYPSCRTCNFLVPISDSPNEDEIFGFSDDDRFFGFAGRDELRGRGGDDELGGGPGIDRVFGGAGRDLLGGGAGIDLLVGGGGRDQLSGNGGSDALHGGGGRDWLTGNAGEDVFLYTKDLDGDHGHDLITDFQPGRDQLGLDFRLEFADLDTNGRLDDADRFVEVERVSLYGATEKSTVIDVGALEAREFHAPFAPTSTPSLSLVSWASQQTTSFLSELDARRRGIRSTDGWRGL